MSLNKKMRLYYNCIDGKHMFPYGLLIVLLPAALCAISLLMNEHLVSLIFFAAILFMLYVYIYLYMYNKWIFIIYSDRITWYRVPRPAKKRRHKCFRLQGVIYKSYYCCLFFSQVECVGVKAISDSEPNIIIKMKNGGKYAVPSFYLMKSYGEAIEAINESPYKIPVRLNPESKEFFVDLTGMPIDEVRKHLRRNFINP